MLKRHASHILPVDLEDLIGDVQLTSCDPGVRDASDCDLAAGCDGQAEAEACVLR